jgi:hypothetical protein
MLGVATNFIRVPTGPLARSLRALRHRASQGSSGLRPETRTSIKKAPTRPTTMKNRFMPSGADSKATITKKFRVTPEDASEIEMRASKSGLTFSEYVRRCALGRRIDVDYNADIVLMLTGIADNIDALRNELRENPGSTLDDEIFRAFVNECIETMQRADLG